MSIDLLNIDAPKVLRPDQPEPSQSPLPARSGASAGTPTDVVSLHDRRPPAQSDLLRQKEEHVAAAGAVREKDKLLEGLGQKVGALKKPLQTIVKQFPPFAPEDKERVELLREYAGLRKEIDQLTFPRPSDDADPSPAHGSGLPAPLSPAASVSQINDHLDDLDAAGVELQRVRGKIASDAASYLENGAFYGALPGAFAASAPHAFASRDENAALQKSFQVGQQIASMTEQGLGAFNSHYLKSLD